MQQQCELTYSSGVAVADAPGDAESKSRRTRPPALAIPACLVIACLLAYANSFFGQFVFDDMPGIVHNTEIRRFPPRTEALTGQLARSLVLLSLSLNYHFHEYRTFGYHAFNLMVHLLAGLTLYGLVRRTLLREPRSSTWHTAAPGLAGAAALLWMLHPLQTESVTYVIQRAEAMMGLFYLLMLYAYLRGVEAGTLMAKSFWYAATVVCCALGMCSKEVMVSAPLVLLMYDRIFLRSSWLEILRQSWPVYVGVGATLFIMLPTVGMAVEGPADAAAPASAGFHVPGRTPWQYLRSQPGVLLHYVRLALWPTPQCLDYEWPVADESLWIFGPGLVILAALAVTIWALWRYPKLGFLGAAYLLILAPTSSFVPLLDLAVEHRMYLPLAPLLVLLVLGGHGLALKLGKRFGWDASGIARREIAAVGVLALMFGFLTATRNCDYFNAATMWGLVVERNPESIRARNNYAEALRLQGRDEEAMHQFYEVLRRVDYGKSHGGLGKIFEKHGRDDEAIAHYQAALRTDHHSPYKYYYRIGLALARQEKWQDAIVPLREAHRLNPGHPLILMSLSRVLEAVGEAEDAMSLYGQALQIAPELGSHVKDEP